MAPDWRISAPTAAHLYEPTPDIRITVVDGNVHEFTFFSDFLKIRLKFAIYLLLADCLVITVTQMLTDNQNLYCL